MNNNGVTVMKKVGICANFGFGRDTFGGQEAKSRTVANEIIRIYGKDSVTLLDTYGGLKTRVWALVRLLLMLYCSDNVVILPARNGVRVIAPLLFYSNLLFNRELHYVVVGGWLPDFLKDRKFLSRILKAFDGIYVETSFMKCALEKQGFRNIFLLPNCKDLVPLTEDELVIAHSVPYRLCTFSRVMKEKGIEDAVVAVKDVNRRVGRTIYTLDIYGQIDPGQLEWFENLQTGFQGEIRYCGIVSYDCTTEVLKDYFALLFPTYYEGEGFAGTILDAFASGVPVIASDWKYNREILTEGCEGAIFSAQDTHALADQLIEIYQNTNAWNAMKLNCLKRAKEYLPEKVIMALIERLR